MEEVTIREASRRLGVSDTAIHKEMKKEQPNRVCVSRITESGRPVLNWEETKIRWTNETTSIKRSHVGPKSQQKMTGYNPEVKLTTSLHMDEPSAHQDNPTDATQQIKKDDPELPSTSGAYNKARGVREVYNAKIAKISFEHKEASNNMSLRKIEAEVRKIEADAELKEINIQKEKKILVYAEEVEDIISFKLAIARDSLMHAPKSFRIQFKDAPAEYAEWLDEYIRAALQNLAGVENVAGMDA